MQLIKMPIKGICRLAMNCSCRACSLQINMSLTVLFFSLFLAAQLLRVRSVDEDLEVVLLPMQWSSEDATVKDTRPTTTFMAFFLHSLRRILIV